MEGIEVIFWVILAIIWLISASLLRRRSQRERGRIQAEGEAYTAPEAGPTEIVEEEKAGEAQLSITFPTVKEGEIVEIPEPQKLLEVEAKVPPFADIRPEVKKPEIELVDLETVGRGIVISEILGPPRAKKPFRRIR